MENVKEYLTAMRKHDGVKGVMIFTADGIIIHTDMDVVETMMYSFIVTQLCDKARAGAKDLEAGDDLLRLRVRTKNREIIIIPEKNYIGVIVQSPPPPED